MSTTKKKITKRPTNKNDIENSHPQRPGNAVAGILSMIRKHPPQSQDLILDEVLDAIADERSELYDKAIKDSKEKVIAFEKFMETHTRAADRWKGRKEEKERRKN